MALPSSGQISLSDIQTEFGGSNPIALSEYYSKGNAPASGEIQLAADFYGTSASIHTTTFTAGIDSSKSGRDIIGYDTNTLTGGVSIGTMTDDDFVDGSNTITIVRVTDDQGSGSFIKFTLGGSPYQYTGWTTAEIVGLGTMNRSSANYTANGGFSIAGGSPPWAAMVNGTTYTLILN
jgi:hypothetical protein